MCTGRERDKVTHKRATTFSLVPILLLEFAFAGLQIRCAEIARAPQCTLSVFNINHRETGKVIINSGSTSLFNSAHAGPFNLTPELKPGENTVHIQFFQAPEPFRTGSVAGWSYGYSISVNNKEIIRSECGFADRIGCTSGGEFPGSFGSRSGTASANRMVYDAALQILYFSIPGRIRIMRQYRGSTWACLASMLISWERARFVSQSEIVEIGGARYKRLLAAGLALNRRELADFCQNVTLKTGAADHTTPHSLVELLRSRGPLWLTEPVGSTTSSSFSNKLLFAVAGDATAEQTYVCLIDPKEGSQYCKRFSELISNSSTTRITFISAK